MKKAILTYNVLDKRGRCNGMQSKYQITMHAYGKNESKVMVLRDLLQKNGTHLWFDLDSLKVKMFRGEDGPGAPRVDTRFNVDDFNTRIVGVEIIDT